MTNLPLPDDMVLLAEYVMAAVKQLVKLIVWVTELIETVLPQPHVLEVTEGFLVRLDPVWAAKLGMTRSGFIMIGNMDQDILAGYL